MKYCALVFLLVVAHMCCSAQTCVVDTVQYNGPIESYLNIVILGDGYTASQQKNFVATAGLMWEHFSNTSPWSRYKSYINVFALEVISEESGYTHPNNAGDCNSAFPAVPTSTANTYLGCAFDAYGIHRLVVPMKAANVARVLADNFPAYDQVLIIANSSFYGGSGGEYATTTSDPNSFDVAVHECGHSFAALSDEYWAGEQYAMESANMTRESDPVKVRWKRWIESGSTIGVYQHSGGNGWYKPSTGCKMQVLNVPFCAVCSEAIVETLHSLVNPIVRYSPTSSDVSTTQRYQSFSLDQLMRPVPNTLSRVWKVDGADVMNDRDTVVIDQNALSEGVHTISVIVRDTTPLVRIDSHAVQHLNVVTWNLRKTSSGLSWDHEFKRLHLSVYPRPTSDFLNVDLGNDHATPFTLELFSLDGKLVQSGVITANESRAEIDVRHLPAASYTLRVCVGNVSVDETVVITR